MKRDLFRRYVWLIDVVRHADKITFEDISNLWIASPLNEDHSAFALRTFHNHRDAIEQLFGIRILCDRSDRNSYYIDYENAPECTRLKIWMLQTLANYNLESEAPDMSSRIILDNIPEDMYGMPTIIEAMRERRVLRLEYDEPGSTVAGRERYVAPYCMRFWNGEWFLLAKDMESREMGIFDLSRILRIGTTERFFVMESGFNSTVFFKNYYGVDVDTSRNPVPVRLRAKGKTRDMIRRHPLHFSQKELISDVDSSLFEYFFVPGDHFIRTILGMGADIEILSPDELRDEFAVLVKKISHKYS